ncbi:DUF1761 domain-containing protein [Jannaschia sp. S6380]|uniref:DUF1761 domain-containing protein n=1 Tax=Jannaschia sp. S6380 TaxID=2926408 RepID=UPI001FF4E122|nr:DUF1761 domain-containing protein [Jannaschia sp. S6380]MCK0169217.1 DUF1761 domain-containing protein [Jannaschia sp. S6380]
MGIVGIIVAGLAGFAFGAVWYSILARSWMAVSGVPVENGQPANRADPVPYVLGLISAVLVAAMLAFVFARAGVDGAGEGFVWGLGAGLFIAAPWLVTCYGFAARPRPLMAIDAGYATFGSAMIGLVLGLF